MTAGIIGPVLVVCAEQERALPILEKLYDEGFSVVGPAPSAGLALTLTAQTMARTAIIAGQTTGRRTAEELADELARTWGVECFILNELEPTETTSLDPLSGGVRATLSRALGVSALSPASL